MVRGTPPQEISLMLLDLKTVYTAFYDYWIHICHRLCNSFKSRSDRSCRKGIMRYRSVVNGLGMATVHGISTQGPESNSLELGNRRSYYGVGPVPEPISSTAVLGALNISSGCKTSELCLVRASGASSSSTTGLHEQRGKYRCNLVDRVRTGLQEPSSYDIRQSVLHAWLLQSI